MLGEARSAPPSCFLAALIKESEHVTSNSKRGASPQPAAVPRRWSRPWVWQAFARCLDGWTLTSRARLIIDGLQPH